MFFSHLLYHYLLPRVTLFKNPTKSWVWGLKWRTIRNSELCWFNALLLSPSCVLEWTGEYLKGKRSFEGEEFQNSSQAQPGLRAALGEAFSGHDRCSLYFVTPASLNSLTLEARKDLISVFQAAGRLSSEALPFEVVKSKATSSWNTRRALDQSSC